MGMNFSPMYQPVSTKTIKADGDLNINPYDLLATDVKCDTVEATEFVGGVGNFSSMVMPTLSYSGYVDYNIGYKYVTGTGTIINHFTLLSSPFPMNGKVSLKYSGYITPYLEVLSTNGKTQTALTTTQTEYDIVDAYSIGIQINKPNSGNTSELTGIITFGIPKFV